MPKVLIVGGAGYVGCVLARELLERGLSVRVFDRLYFGQQGLASVADRVQLAVGDMRALDSSLLEGVDAVVNLGGLSNDPTAEYNPEANHEMNAVATERLAALCRDAGVRRYVLASSCAIYDRGVNGEDLVLDETAEVRPQAAYSSSKLEAERRLLAMVDDSFCPVVLRKGTIFGFSPRMRYDLVVNTFVKDALRDGRFTLFYGGEMWRPLIDVRDVARAYALCLTAPEEDVRGEVFNLSADNYRISELGLRVREALRDTGVAAEIEVDHRYRGVRSYRVSTDKIARGLGFRAKVSVEASVRELVEGIREAGLTDFDNPRYYNIRWMRLLEEAAEIVAVTGSVFGGPEEPRR